MNVRGNICMEIEQEESGIGAERVRQETPLSRNHLRLYSLTLHLAMGNEHGKEHDPNGHGAGAHTGTGEKVKKGGKKPKKPVDVQPAAAPSTSKPTVLKDIDTSRLKHAVTDPIEDYYTVTEKVLGRYVQGHNCAKMWLASCPLSALGFWSHFLSSSLYW
jgi:hypothetical protein